MKFINACFFGTVFFVVLTPIGLIIRIFGYDGLRLKVRVRKSYWRIRDSNKSDKEVFENQSI